MAIAPIITFPTTAPGFSTNLKSQTIMGTADTSTVSLLVNGSTGGVSYTSGATSWTFVVMLEDGENIFNFEAVDTLGSPSSPETITISYISEDNLNLIVSAPTGIFLERSKDAVTTSVIENPEPEVIGYNFYGSEFAGGGTVGFTLLNPTLITESSFFKENNIVLSETVETSGDIRSTFTVEKLSKENYFSYKHNRVNQPLGTKPLSENNHYVVTAVAFDNSLQQQVESAYSSELGASPLLLDTTLRELPARTTFDIQKSYIDEILKTDKTIDVKPGTVTRDIHINPPSDEFERLYIILDFLHKSQSFLTLLEFDDSDGDGESDDVLITPGKVRLKEALLISDENADDVQRLIDSSFTNLAANVNAKRKEEQKASGQVLFYTRVTPTRDAVINAGGLVETLFDETTPSVQFQVLTDFTLKVAELENYYNTTTNRYEVILDVQAVVAGAAGNVDAGKIQIIISGIDSVFGVENPNPTDFGQDIESNRKLAERAMLAFVSVDAGTEAGYLATTLGTPNVQRTKIISAGESLMQRDLDPLRLLHTFGKVDIYLQGSQQTSYSETFGFTYDTVKNARAIIQNVAFFHFRVNNPEINITKPIFGIIEIRNVTRGATYDTTGFEVIGDGEVVDLNETLTVNSSIGLSPSDIVVISYRYRDSNPITFKNQPVESILSVVGSNSGNLTSANYVLQKLEDPLAFGNSTAAKDQMSLVYANGVPVGDMLEIFDESLILNGENEVELKYYGVDVDTVIVTSNTNLITYQRDIDFTVIPGYDKEKTKIKRIPAGGITSGQNVFVDYLAGENFTVTYYVNTLLQNVQNRIDTMRHLTADVVIKSAIKTYIDFDLTIVIEEGSDQTSVDRKIRTAIAKLLQEKQIGESVYQSDIVDVIESISGVNHTLIPFTKMVKANGSIVNREVMNTSWDTYQTINVISYKSVSKLSWPTTVGGGPITTFRGVFENDIPLLLVDNLDLVAEGPGRAYIAADGTVYASTKLGNIQEAEITVTYIVQNATGARDIDFCEIEYGAVGNLIITYEFIKKFKGF